LVLSVSSFFQADYASCLEKTDETFQLRFCNVNKTIQEQLFPSKLPIFWKTFHLNKDRKMTFPEALWERQASETAIRDSTIWHDWEIQMPN